MAQAAQAHGLAYHYIPVISGQVTQEQVTAFADVLAQADGPVLAFCRSGARSTNMWHMGK
jgi:sulfide:quinone oxidoreductase